MTAGSSSSDVGFCTDSPGDPGVCFTLANSNTRGSLTSPSFSLGGATYEVVGIMYFTQAIVDDPVGLYLGINPGLPGGTAARMTLRIGDDSWPLASATRETSPGADFVNYYWDESSSPFASGSTYSVSLSLASGVGGGGRSAARYVPTPYVDPRTCDDFSGAIVINSASAGAQCQPVTEASIGDEALRRAGYLAAVDIWAYVAPGTEVCFARAGAIMMLDAGTAPRRLLRLASYESAGRTCARIDRAGTVVLMTPEAARSVATEAPACAGTVSAYLLNFRAAPNFGRVIGLIPGGEAVPVTQRDGDWLGAVHAGRAGWIHRGYVALAGVCDGL